MKLLINTRMITHVKQLPQVTKSIDIDIEDLFCVEYYKHFNISPVGLFFDKHKSMYNPSIYLLCFRMRIYK